MTTTKDETLYTEPQKQEQAAAHKASSPKSGTSHWQSVTIGGVTGIVMGAASSLAANAYAANKADAPKTEDAEVETETASGTVTQQEQTTNQTEETAHTTTSTPQTDVQQAEVSQDLSFSQAFAAARAEVGSGGVFMWHGRLYNTFTAEEWSAMNDAQKDEFAAEVQPYLAQQTAPQNSAPHHTETVHTTTVTDNPAHVQPAVHTDVPTEPEVHFLGVDSHEVEGQTVNIGHMTINDVNVALVDVDNDEVFDVSVTDLNNNQEVEDNEITDISDHGITVEDFEAAVIVDQMMSETDDPLQATNHTDDLEPDMPDYVNDADGTLV